MERHFDEELKKFNKALLKMATLTEDSIFHATEALKKHDSELAKKVIADDQLIDDEELKVEDMGIQLLALRQPLAVDLRFITTGIKINAELERIADLAVNICQRVLELGTQEYLKPVEDIAELSLIARKMVKDVIDAFVNHNEDLAKQVILADQEANAIKDDVQEELIYDFMIKDGTVAPRAVPLLLVARHLERICDHATYIAEDVIYIVEAKVIRHHRSELKEEE